MFNRSLPNALSPAPPPALGGTRTSHSLWTRPTTNGPLPGHKELCFTHRHPMSNLLAFPFKRTVAIPVAQTARKYIQDNLPDSNVDAFKWDFKEWEALRKRTMSDVIHIDLIQHFLECVTSQILVMSRLIPVQLSRSACVHLDEAACGRRYPLCESHTRTETIYQIGLEFPYLPAFASSATTPISLANLLYERCGVLFNLASLYSQIAYAEDRSSPEGLKAASKYFQVNLSSRVQRLVSDARGWDSSLQAF